ncbi:hypothetical protein TIFTF001_023998 [Ficus carica]|uniref:DDE Tnp4 domain-containing protein n=1 Tax=Ficus carica TaxID=3494 RepID=A0AA88AH80_FICCA|nr:hypothetical protein TIFTF001_023998 [Ficus carica]
MKNQMRGVHRPNLLPRPASPQWGKLVLCGGAAHNDSKHVVSTPNSEHSSVTGLPNKELYYNVFEKTHAAGASGYGSVTMGGDNTYVDYDFNFDYSGTQTPFEEDPTPNHRTLMWHYFDTHPQLQGPFCEIDDEDRKCIIAKSSANIIESGNINMNEHDSGPHHDDDDHGSENAQRDVDAMLAMAMVAATIERCSRHRDPVPMHNSRLTVLLVICGLKDEFIRPPDYTAVQPLIMEHGYKYRPWFDGCIGAIDGTHVPCVPSQENADAWINRKGQHTQNILAACSFDMRFTYMLAGYEGSCHDARMLGEAIAFHGFPIPPPDSGYANKDCFLSPYRRETYHLPEYRRRRGGLGNRREIGDPLLEEYAADCMPVPENVDVSADYVFDDIFDGTCPSTGTQLHDSRRDAMNQLKDIMTDEMWDRYQSAP